MVKLHFRSHRKHGRVEDELELELGGNNDGPSNLAGPESGRKQRQRQSDKAKKYSYDTGNLNSFALDKKGRNYGNPKISFDSSGRGKQRKVFGKEGLETGGGFNSQRCSCAHKIMNRERYYGSGSCSASKYTTVIKPCGRSNYFVGEGLYGGGGYENDQLFFDDYSHNASNSSFRQKQTQANRSRNGYGSVARERSRGIGNSEKGTRSTNRGRLRTDSSYSYFEPGAYGDVVPEATENDDDDDDDDNNSDDSLFGDEEDGEEDLRNFDRPRDWATCIAAVIVIASTLGVVQSYAVFAPAIQHHYEIGVLETVLVGCLSYFGFIIFLPVATLIKVCLGYRRTALLGMTIFFLGIMIDAFTLGAAFLYVTHIIFMGFGGSLAYAPAMSICSHHFRRHLAYALSLISCAGAIGTIFIYLLCNLMLSFISYRWTRICLAIFLLICSGATQTFPTHNFKFKLRQDKYKIRAKKCIRDYARERDEMLAAKLSRQDIPKKTSMTSTWLAGALGGTCCFSLVMLVCICDISLWTDYSFLLWVTISTIAVMTVYIPYLFMVAYAYTIGTEFAIGAVAYFCITSILGRVACTNISNHTFVFNRTIFQLCCVGSGALYIFLDSVDSLDMIVAWGIVIGWVDGVTCVIIPRLTLQTVPSKVLDHCCTWMSIFHAFAVIVGPMLLMSVYYNSLEYGPALMAIGVTQIIAGLLAFILPNTERDEFEDLLLKYYGSRDIAVL